MSVKEKRWRLFYKILMIIIYAVVIPLALLLFIMLDENIPWGVIIAAIALPFMRKKHLNQIRKQEL